MPYTVFEYLYRDASNYKAHGRVWLAGTAAADDHARIAACLHEGLYFIPEQLNLPALQALLFPHSDGVTDDDHSWHEFCALRCEVQPPPDGTIFMSLDRFIEAISALNGRWDAGQSALAHFDEGHSA